MKKNENRIVKNLLVSGVALALLLFVAFTVSVKAEFSFTDLLAKYAGERIGDKVASQIDVGELNDKLGAFPGGEIFNSVQFRDGITVGG